MKAERYKGYRIIDETSMFAEYEIYRPNDTLFARTKSKADARDIIDLHLETWGRKRELRPLDEDEKPKTRKPGKTTSREAEDKAVGKGKYLPT